jgi:hypothetical protein
MAAGCVSLQLTDISFQFHARNIDVVFSQNKLKAVS